MSKPAALSTNGGDDRTIVRPSPGGRRRHEPAMPQRPDRISERSRLDAQLNAVAEPNPLLANAFLLLSLVSKLRILAFHHAINELQEQLVDAIRNFEDRTRQQGSSPEQVKIASYFLCSLLDETVMNTPWGNQSNWGHHSLLVQFHNEAWGGERFFQILDRVKQHPAQNLSLLELSYLCLSLGFEGKFRVAGSSVREIEQLRQELFLLIQRTRGDSERALSARWKGLRGIRSPLMQYVPLWVMIAVAGSLLMLTYLGFSYAANSASDRVYKELSVLARQEATVPGLQFQQPALPVSIPIRENRFKKILGFEITRGMVEVLDENTLRIADSFTSGSDQVKKEFIPLLNKIAQELQADNSRIVVTGHTDDVPIFTARFPSNWHLSQARARSVANILLASAPLRERVTFEGRAESEPIAPNDTAENRALNRRIEIQIR
jgi:type VI secretion system protein ImpK